MQGDGGGDEEDHDMPIATITSLTEHLVSQLGFLKLSEEEELIGIQLIGSTESDGYIRRPLQAIVNDMAFTQGIYTDAAQIENVLAKIQTFDPAGIGARDLQECLLLQLDRKDTTDPLVQYAIRIIEDMFDEFSKKHYDKIQRRLNIDDDQLKATVKIITRLNPKPGNIEEDSNVQYLLPDYILVNNNGP
jgi:RNA polymerase sigma-54 factor